jgi:hypothetical protein
MKDEAQEMQGIRLVGLDLQNLPVDRLRFLQTTRLVVLKGNIDRFRNCRHEEPALDQPTFLQIVPVDLDVGRASRLKTGEKALDVPADEVRLQVHRIAGLLDPEQGNVPLGKDHR